MYILKVLYRLKIDLRTKGIITIFPFYWSLKLKQVRQKLVNKPHHVWKIWYQLNHRSGSSLLLQTSNMCEEEGDVFKVLHRIDVHLLLKYLFLICKGNPILSLDISFAQLCWSTDVLCIKEEARFDWEESLKVLMRKPVEDQF